MRIFLLSPAVALAFCLAVPGNAAAEPTPLTVRVIAKDAKFIGSSIGGMRITVRDAVTGEILASGVTAGGTGDTKRVMHKDGGRRAPLAGASAAKFETSLDLDEPRLIEVEAYGPLAQPQAAHRVSSTQWMVPGKSLAAGDGWVLELPGFIVDVLDPAAHVRLSPGTKTVDLSANVTMMCGCPLKPGGLWDADKMEVKARVRHNGKYAGSVPLAYGGRASRFTGRIKVEGPGLYDVTVYAYDPRNGNTGLDRTTFIIPKAE